MIKEQETMASPWPAAVDWLTVERALWAGVLLLAAMLRCWDLGGLPLQVGEAAKALTSWQMVQGQGTSAVEGPLLIYGNALIFLGFGASDASARVLPALAGTALIGLPFLLREQIGRRGALMAALLLAISPTLLYFGRLVDGQSLSAAAALGVVVCLARVGTGAGRRWRYAAAAALGLLMLMGRDTYTMLLVLAGAATVVGLRWRGHGEGVAAEAQCGSVNASVRSTGTRTHEGRGYSGDAGPVGSGFTPAWGGVAWGSGEPFWAKASAPWAYGAWAALAAGGGQELRRAALLAGVVVALGTTALLTNLHGVQEGLVTPLEGWLLSLLGGDQPWHFQLQVMLVYEPALLVFGAVGSVAGLRSGNGTQRFLVWWAGVALVVSSLSGERPGAGIALALVPLALLAGPAAARTLSGLWATVPRHELAIYLGAMLSLLVLFWLATHFFTLPGAGLPATVPFGPFELALRTLGDIAVPGQIMFLLAALGGMGFWIGPRRLPELVGLLALVVLVVMAFHAAVLLNYAAYASAAELPVAARTTRDVRALVGDVADSVDALATGNRPRAVRVATRDQAVLGWYLRDEPGASFGGRAVANEALVIAEAEDEPPAGKFAAQRYRLLSTWTDGAGDMGKFWRWLTLREPPGAVRYDDVVLYVRVP